MVYGPWSMVHSPWSIVITFLLLFIVNFVLSTIYIQLVPPKTG